jgi:hypothetical protein
MIKIFYNIRVLLELILSPESPTEDVLTEE